MTKKDISPETVERLAIDCELAEKVITDASTFATGQGILSNASRTLRAQAERIKELESQAAKDGPWAMFYRDGASLGEVAERYSNGGIYSNTGLIQPILRASREAARDAAKTARNEALQEALTGMKEAYQVSNHDTATGLGEAVTIIEMLIEGATND